MSARFWQLAECRAKAETDRFSTEVNLLQPQDGFHNLRIATAAQSAARFSGKLLAVQLAEPGKEIVPEDVYIRENDLIATYPQDRSRPFRSQIYWRLVPGDQSKRLTQLEIVLSQQTELLDSQSEVMVTSSIGAEQVLQATDHALTEFKPIATATQQSTERTLSAEPGLFVYRLPGLDVSYLEMVPETDYCGASLLKMDDGESRLTYRLFARFLEKGVILRARVRGLFVLRADDLELARTAYRALREEKLPLTT